MRRFGLVSVESTPRPRWLLWYAAAVIAGVPVYLLLFGIISAVLNPFGLLPTDAMIYPGESLGSHVSWVQISLEREGLAAIPWLILVEGVIFGLLAVGCCHAIWSIKYSRKRRRVERAENQAASVGRGS